jgi:hypothetical protein
MHTRELHATCLCSRLRPPPPRRGHVVQLVAVFLAVDLLLIGLDYINSIRTGSAFVF